MTDEERIEAKQQVADRVADEVTRLIHGLIEDGFPADAVLAGALAGVITSMVMAMGGPATAAACRRAEARIKDMPSAAAAALATTPPRGTA